MSSREGFVLGNLDLNDGVTYTLETLSTPAAKKKPQWISGADSDGAELAEEPHFDNAVVTLRVLVEQQATMDLALAAVGALTDKLQEASRGGVVAVWKPAGSTEWRMLDILMGEIDSLPIVVNGSDVGWFVNRPVAECSLTRRPGMRGEEIWPGLRVDTVAADSIEGYGHSYVLAYGVDVAEGFYSRVAARYGLSSSQSSAVGGRIIETLSTLFASAGLTRTTGSTPRLGVVMIGINDLTYWVGGGLPALFIAIVSLVSRMRVEVGDAFTSTDPSVTLGAGWTAGTAPYFFHAPSSATITIDVSGFPAGGIAGVILPCGQGQGALHTFDIDGSPPVGSAATFDTRGLYPASPSSPSAVCPWVARVGIPPGASTLTVTITSITGFAWFYGWHMESDSPPLTVLVKQPRTPLGIDMDPLNDVIDLVEAAYGDDRVIVADADGAIDADPVLFLSDLLHLKPEGHRLLAQAVMDGVAENAHAAFGVSSSEPVATLEVANVPGDLSPLTDFVVDEGEGEDRRYIRWGREAANYDPSLPLILDSDMLDTSGYAGTGDTRTGAYDVGGGNTVITSTLRTQTQAICSTGEQAHVGTFRVFARVWCDATTIALTLAWNVGGGEFTTNLPFSQPVVVGWNDVPLGVVTIEAAESGAQTWSGRVMAYSTTSGGEAFEVNYLALMPASEDYGVALASYTHRPGVLGGSTDFGSVAALALNGLSAEPVGHTWATSGATTDFATIAAPLATDLTVARSTTSDASRRMAVLGPTTYTDMEVGVDLYATETPSLTFDHSRGLLARYVDASNFLLVEIGRVGLRVFTMIGGSFTVARGNTEVADLVPADAWAGLRAVVFASGAGVAQLCSTSGRVAVSLPFWHADLATGGALESGKPGFFDRNLTATAVTRYYDNFYAATPHAESIALYADRSIQFGSNSTKRYDSTGVHLGNPPSYVGSRVKLAPDGGVGRKNRFAVMDKRFDPETFADDNIADTRTLSVRLSPLFLNAPR